VDGNEVLKAVADELGIDKCSASAVLRAVRLQKAAAHSAIDDLNTLRSEAILALGESLTLREPLLEVSCTSSDYSKHISNVRIM
jgi:hypothetical protein